MYYIECPVSQTDSFRVFIDLTERGHLRFYGIDLPNKPEITIFRICLPEALRYGLPIDMISSSYSIYDQEHSCNVNNDLDLSLRRGFGVNQDLTLVMGFNTVRWDKDREKFIFNFKLFDYQNPLSKGSRMQEMLRCLGFPKEFFVENPIFGQLSNDKYVFENTADIWK